MKINEIITEARDAVDKEFNSPRYKKDPVDDAERYGLEHDQPYDLDTGQMDARDFLQLALPKLSPRIRKVLVLKWFHGLDQREIADRLGIEYGKVRELEVKGLRRMRDWSAKNNTGFERDPTAWFESVLREAKLGTAPKRPSRSGSRPDRGHEPVKRYKDKEVTATEDQELEERGRASRSLCLSAKPDSELGASQLSSCKSQGLRARDGEKSHKISKGGKKTRVKVGGHKIKGHKYGGPLPDWS
jgi:hypothetical protein